MRWKEAWEGEIGKALAPTAFRLGDGLEVRDFHLFLFTPVRKKRFEIRIIYTGCSRTRPHNCNCRYGNFIYAGALYIVYLEF